VDAPKLNESWTALQFVHCVTRTYAHLSYTLLFFPFNERTRHSDYLIIYIYIQRSRDSSVGIATGYSLIDRGSDPGRGKILLLLTASKRALAPTQSPIQWIPGALSLGAKRLEREADHSPRSAEVKNGRAIPLLLHMSSRHSA
jgi:hypothetical protein